MFMRNTVPIEPLRDGYELELHSSGIGNYYLVIVKDGKEIDHAMFGGDSTKTLEFFKTLDELRKR